MVSFTLSFICNYQPRERTYPSRNAPCSPSPPSLHCRAGCGSTTKGGDGREERKNMWAGKSPEEEQSVGCGLWAVGYGLWAMGCGRGGWTTAFSGMIFQLWFSILVQMQREYKQVKFDLRKGIEVD